MKIVFISTDKSLITNKNGDAYGRHKAYAQHFEELTVVVFSLKKEKLKETKWKNLRVIPTSSSSRFGYITDSLKILNSLEKPDLISTQDPFITALVGIISKIYWQTKLNIQIHNDFFRSKYFRQENVQNFIFYWLGKFNLLFADTIRIVNKRLLDDKRCFIAPVPADLGFFWDKPHTKQYGQIVTVARLSKQKNLPLFFELAKKFPALRFVVVGEGEERRNLEKVLPNNVFLVGQKSRSEIKKIFAESDLYVQTSNYEGWGLSIIEAISSGLPVITTDTGCAGEVVQNGKAGGVVTQIGKIDFLVFATETFLKKRTSTLDLIYQGQKLLQQRHNKIQLVKQLINGLKKTK